MGGFGSGRRGGSGRDTVEACRSLDVNRLHRAGCLHACSMGGWQWTRDGEKAAHSLSLHPKLLAAGNKRRVRSNRVINIVVTG